MPYYFSAFSWFRIRVDIEFSHIFSPRILSPPPCTRWRDVPSITTLQMIWATWTMALRDTRLHLMAATWRSSPRSCRRRRVWMTSSYAHAALLMGSSLLSVCNCHRTMQRCILCLSRSPQKVRSPFTISVHFFYKLLWPWELKIVAVIWVLWSCWSTITDNLYWFLDGICSQGPGGRAPVLSVFF